MLRFPDRGAHRPIMAAVAFVGALSTADVQADPFHRNHYHGGSWGRPGVSISIGGGGINGPYPFSSPPPGSSTPATKSSVRYFFGLAGMRAAHGSCFPVD